MISMKELELEAELQFMYKKYEELCAAYKKLANSKLDTGIKTVHDMSQMKFQNEKEIM